MDTVLHPMRRIFNTFLAIFLVISATLIYWQVAKADYLTSLAYNPRSCAYNNTPQRGTIYDRNGVKLAYSVPDPNAPCGWKRIYTDPSLAPLIGFYDPTGFGITGLEATFNTILSGPPATQNTSIKQGISNLIAQTEHAVQHGNNIYLTIDDRIQKNAYQSYAGNDGLITSTLCPQQYQYTSSGEGSIIVEDPQSGELLAWVSYPTFDPNILIDHSFATDGQTDSQGYPLTVGQEYFNTLLQDPNKPLIDQPAMDIVIPGSSFKMYTMIAALESGQYTAQTAFDQTDAQEFTVNGQIINSNHLPNNTTYPVDITHAFAYSDNVIFARLTVGLGAQKWLSYANMFGISYGQNIAQIPFEVPLQNSWIYQQGADFSINALAAAGYGQGYDQMTPLTMSVIDSSVAADGKIYDPHVLLKSAPYGQPASSIADQKPQLLGQYSAQTAYAIQAAMRADLQYGTVAERGGYFLTYYNSPVLMGSKTGTAQVANSNYSQEWFLTLAPDDVANPTTNPPKLTVIVNKINGGFGECLIPIAQEIYQYALPLEGYQLP